MRSFDLQLRKQPLYSGIYWSKKPTERGKPAVGQPYAASRKRNHDMQHHMLTILSDAFGISNAPAVGQIAQAPLIRTTNAGKRLVHSARDDLFPTEGVYFGLALRKGIGRQDCPFQKTGLSGCDPDRPMSTQSLCGSGLPDVTSAPFSLPRRVQHFKSEVK